MANDLFSQMVLANPLTDEEKDQALENGDRDLLIETHMRLAMKVAQTFQKRGGSRDEMLSAALVGLVEGANDLVLGDDITGSLYNSMAKSCRNALDNQPVVKRPRGATCPKVFESNGTEAVEDYHNIDVMEVLTLLPRTKLEHTVLSRRCLGEDDYEIADALGIDRSYVIRIRSMLFDRYRSLT